MTIQLQAGDYFRLLYLAKAAELETELARARVMAAEQRRDVFIAYLTQAYPGLDLTAPCTYDDATCTLVTPDA